MAVADKLRAFVRRVNDLQDADVGLGDDVERVAITEAGGTVALDFFGHPFFEAFAALLDLLLDREVAGTLGGLIVRGPDAGANGVREWDFSRITSSDVVFPALQLLSIELTQPGWHNMSSVGRNLEEAGQIAALLAKAPSLRHLTAPSAPGPDFFAQPRPLRTLSIDAGFDHRDFIRSLARSTSFDELQVLEYGEALGRGFAPTPFESLELLVTAPMFRNVKRLVLRNPVATREELRRLRTLAPGGVQILVVRSSDEYL